jgi:hypothetical protein
MTVVPAYGRDYKSIKDVRAAWDAGKDFQITDLFSGNDGRYVNKADSGGMTIMARYSKLRKITKVQ